MLIVAIPKSGSTSIMETLGIGHSLTHTQKANKEMPQKRGALDPRILPLLLFHGDIFDYEVSYLVDAARSRSHLFKQHITPTPSNRQALKGEKIVILLREPEAIVDAYHRGFAKQIHRIPEGLPRDVGIEEWRTYAATSGLLDSLRWFHDSWSTDTDPNWLILDFEQLTGSPQDSIRAIEQHFGLPSSGVAVLRKARYSKSLFIPYRHNRVWKDRVQRWKSGLKRISLGLLGGLARFTPARIKHSAWARSLAQRIRP